MAYLRSIPNMTIASPINEHWLRNLMYTAQLRSEGPMAIRYPRGGGVLPEWKNEMQEVEIGRGQCLTSGDAPVAVLTMRSPVTLLNLPGACHVAGSSSAGL